MQYISIIGTGQEMKKKKKIDVFFIEIKRKKKKKVFKRPELSSSQNCLLPSQPFNALPSLFMLLNSTSNSN